MTTETKTFISADEIIGISVECCNCNVKSQIRFNSDGWARTVSERTVCPHCNHRWFISATDPIHEAVVSFVAALIDMRVRTKELESRAVPFSITLEISEHIDSRRQSIGQTLKGQQ
jgi:hypothetical protein